MCERESESERERERCVLGCVVWFCVDVFCCVVFVVRVLLCLSERKRDKRYSILFIGTSDE